MFLAPIPPRVGAGAALFALVDADGSGAEPYLRSAELLAGRTAPRNFADFVHLLSLLHGAFPGVVDRVAGTPLAPAARRWVEAAVDGFAAERALLLRLQAAAGPIPSTPHADRAAGAVLGQRAALDILARSERTGCALGAAAALVLDWGTVRALLDHAADRLGVAPAALALPGRDALAVVLDAAAPTHGAERALLFGAEQLLVQHRSLWRLLRARRAARAEVEV